MIDYRSLKWPAMPADVRKIVVTWGVGTDSTAILAIMHAINVRPDAIIFADPGNERQETYDYFNYFVPILKEWSFPSPNVVRRRDVVKMKRPETLGEENIRISTGGTKTGKAGAGLPSVAFGMHRCSMKFKAEVINGWLKKQAWVVDEMAAGHRIAKVIGYESTETGRSCNKTFKDASESRMAVPLYPLMDWKIDRATAIEILTDMGLRLPGKSACTYCPHAHDSEWRQLAKDDPVAWELALRMEALARPHVRKPEDVGLRRRGKRGERQLVAWAQKEGLPVPTNLDDAEAARMVLGQVGDRNKEFWKGLLAQQIVTSAQAESAGCACTPAVTAGTPNVQLSLWE